MTKGKIATTSVAPVNWRAELTSNLASRYSVIFLPLLIVGVLSMGYLAYQDKYSQPASNLTSTQSEATKPLPTERLKAKQQPNLPDLTTAADAAETDSSVPAVTDTTSPSAPTTTDTSGSGPAPTNGASQLQQTDTSANSEKNSDLQATKGLKLDLSQLEQLHIQIPLLH
jgi:hypothetical protein